MLKASNACQFIGRCTFVAAGMHLLERECLCGAVRYLSNEQRTKHAELRGYASGGHQAGHSGQSGH